APALHDALPISGTCASAMEAVGDSASGKPANESVRRASGLPSLPSEGSCAAQIRQSKPIFNNAKLPALGWLLVSRRQLFKIENPFLIRNDNIHEAITVNILNNIVQPHARVFVNNVQHPFGAFSRPAGDKLQPENSRREGLPRVVALMGKITHAAYQIQVAIPVDIGRRQRMGLRIVAIHFTKFPGGPTGGIAPLLIPPHAVSVGRRAYDIGITITIYIHHMHLGTRQPQIGRMEQPVRLFGIRRGFPPPLLDDHITAPVAVNVTETEPVRKDGRSGHILAADGVAVPRSISYLRRASEPDHLSSIR